MTVFERAVLVQVTISPANPAFILFVYEQVVNIHSNEIIEDIHLESHSIQWDILSAQQCDALQEPLRTRKLDNVPAPTSVVNFTCYTATPTHVR